MRRLTVLLFVVAMIAAFALPAMGTLHPIQSGDCNGFDDEFHPSAGEPPGISDFSKPNVARPLFATGWLITFEPFVFDPTVPAANGQNGNCPNGEEPPGP